MILTHARLLQILSYDPLTGIFIWREDRGRFHCSGKEAGGLDSEGYCQITIDDRQYFAHRLAWLYVTGKWPKFYMDHRDLDKANNRLSNLRECTHSQNRANSRARSICGLKGVTWHKKTQRWQAKIKANGRNHWLGLFDDPLAASAAYAEAAQEHFGEFARLA